MDKLTSVNIRPGVTILSVLKHLNYKPYYALAEFVDNSIDSYLKNEDELKKIEGSDFKLEVTIEFNTSENKIIIRDNAAGIHSEDFPRAFRAAEMPPNNLLLSEFGMGMKSASCWFSNKWEVRTKALNEDVQRIVKFDIEQIVNDQIDELKIVTKKANLNSHFTTITLLDVQEKMPVKRAMSKVKHHLASIYREFIRKGILVLKVNKEKLKYSTPKILNVPRYDIPDGEPILWKKEIEGFDFGDDGKGGKLRASGFVALMETMQIKKSGFALFRRGRVIEGSADDNNEGFRPPLISGSLGSHRYKRLFGEIHLEGFKVSHTKDGFQWDDNMEAFLDLLKQELEGDASMPILKQADKYRVRESAKSYAKVSKKVVNNTTESIKNGLSEDVNSVREKEPVTDVNPEPLSESKQSYFREFQLKLNDCDWNVHVELSYDDSIMDFMQVGNHLIPDENKKSNRQIGIRLSLVHPFMVQFAGDNSNIIEPILRLAVALGLSEAIACELKLPVTEVRKNMNELLYGSLTNQ